MKTNKKTLYLCGRMTGVKHHNFPKFFRAEARLQKAGYKVVNPARLNTPGEAWIDCLRNDIKYIVNHCDGIALLDDWMLSRGAKLELAIALRLEMFVISAHTLRPMNITLEKLFSHHRRNKYVARYKG
jgi:hypothetical protein